MAISFFFCLLLLVSLQINKFDLEIPPWLLITNLTSLEMFFIQISKYEIGIASSYFSQTIYIFEVATIHIYIWHPSCLLFFNLFLTITDIAFICYTTNLIMFVPYILFAELLLSAGKLLN